MYYNQLMFKRYLSLILIISISFSAVLLSSSYNGELRADTESETDTDTPPHQCPEYDFENKTIDDIIAEYMEDKGLNEYNFSISYYNTVTGEEFSYNDMCLMLPASTYKLPLNMYYYERQADGTMSEDDIIPGSGGLPLSTCHYRSIVESDNDISIAMQNNLGGFYGYKEKMTYYFTIPYDDIPATYFRTNVYCTRMMVDVLKYLYANSDSFDELINYMLIACPDHFFKKYSGDIPVAHKYGSYDAANHDVGIIYTDEPFLLAVYTLYKYETISSDMAELFIAYTEYTHEKTVEESLYESSLEASISASESESASIASSIEASLEESASVSYSIYESESRAVVESVDKEADAVLQLEKDSLSLKKSYIIVGTVAVTISLLITALLSIRAYNIHKKKHKN